MQVHTAVSAILTFLSCTTSVTSECTHLPSGLCFVDCTVNPLEVVCEDVSTNQLQSDLEIFSGLNASFTLHLWNSPGIERLGLTTFLNVQDLLKGLKLQNLVNLQIFPEVKSLSGLKSLTIQNAPKLSNFPVELLPEKIKSIHIRRTGILEFLADRSELIVFPYLKYYRIEEQTIHLLDRYFMIFPNIEIIEITGCNVRIDDLDNNPLPFMTRNPLKKLTISNNTFSVSDIRLYYELFHQIVAGLQVDEKSEVEISENAFPIAKKTVRILDHLAPIKRLSLRGSYFEDYNTLENLFINFTNLVYLDLGHTHLPSMKGGIFRGLPNLETLKLDGNSLRGVEKIDFFQGLAAKNLSVLSLADNFLTDHPKDFERWGRNIRDYDLSGNKLTRAVFTDRAQYFPVLMSMNQARNQRTDWVSKNLVQMKTLVMTDLSCNNFRNITADFFSGYPPSTRIMNLTQCIKRRKDRPLVAADAFTKFPAIQTLYFDGAFLKSNFLLKLQKMSNKSAQALKELYLRNNGIAFLHRRGRLFTPFINLTTLDLSKNKFQSTGSYAFSSLKNLIHLNLANNALFSIGPMDFYGLDHLEYLDLSGNKMLLIAPRSFDMLSRLRGLFLHNNNLDEESMPLKVFSKGKGYHLTHLSIGNLPVSCLDPKLISRFRYLDWIYLNDSTPLFIHDPRKVLTVEALTRAQRMHRWGGLKFCEEQRSLEDVQARQGQLGALADDFVRVQISDPDQQIYQNMYLVYNTCFMSNARQIKNKVDILCRKA